jgi:hypothetical protein
MAARKHLTELAIAVARTMVALQPAGVIVAAARVVRVIVAFV